MSFTGWRMVQMLSALVEAAQRFRREGELPPRGYKPKAPKRIWIVNLEEGSVFLEGPYTQKEPDTLAPHRLLAPDRQRSGTPSETNLKPYLLVDDARYSLGKAEPGKEEEARLLHRGFVALLESAYKRTQVPELKAIIDFLKSNKVEEVRTQVGPKDIIRFLVDGEDPAESPAVQAFWAEYLATELVAGHRAHCGICGAEAHVLRIFPREVVVLGQKCQITSFNSEAFASYGKAQTENAPTCFACGSDAVDALDYLIRSERHHRTLLVGGGARGLENQLAVFWLQEKVELIHEDRVYDLEALLGAVLGDVDRTSGPPAELSQLDALLGVPWNARASALNVDESRFYLAVLSTNKARLVVRDWLETSVGRIRDNLRLFLAAQRIVDPYGQTRRVFPIPVLLAVLKAGDPNVTHDLLRAAYLGLRPREGLLEVALQRIRNPKVLRNPQMLHPLLALIKLVLTYGGEEAISMEVLDITRDRAAYLSGRLLAVLEEAQRRASGGNLNSTLTDRFYAAVAAAPAANLAILLARAKVSHLPKIRREGRGYKEIEGILEEIFTRLEAREGLPAILNPRDQAEFALGYYHQRAQFRQEAREVSDKHHGESMPERR
ncbi:MAG: type I-C CRISPR-associated protein Cas8c/Csd1 [Clostridia bacterium]|jgi:CRISPR-associated protein Csd1|nr:type I-C CRISPR-associated protein Cas8c/Csd1 [Clostridia bacterium]